MNSQLNKGFSLVELAIVLVIIGLITGGILTGQELIRSAELNSVISNVNKMKIALNTFKLKYNGQPGDLQNATAYWGVNAGSCPNGNSLTGTCNGNGNGQIDHLGGNPWGVNNESFRAVQQLGLAGLIPGQYTGAVSGPNPIAVVCGTNAWCDSSNNRWYFPLYQVATSFSWNRQGAIVHNYSSGAGGGGEIYTPTEAFSIDTKYDDGKPGLGKMTSPSANSCATTSDPNTAAFSLTNNNTICHAYFWLD